MRRIVPSSATRIVLFSAIGMSGLLLGSGSADSAQIPSGAVRESLTGMLAGFSAETGTEARLPAALPVPAQAVTHVPAPEAPPAEASPGPPPAKTTAATTEAPVLGGQALGLKGFLSFWTQDCGSGCGLPQPASAALPVELSLPLPSQPGEAATARVERQTALGMDKVLQAKVTVFAVCPRPAGPTGAGASGPLPTACQDRYFQVQVEVRGDTEVFCGMSMNEADLLPFPVLMCAGTSKSEPARRVGVTLHRKPL